MDIGIRKHNNHSYNIVFSKSFLSSYFLIDSEYEDGAREERATHNQCYPIITSCLVDR